ncbi:MAG: hypothetical protein WCS95_09515 [Lentisphaeria bacterium]|jgi:hypothetical protein|nr:hypothetical protein [Lentisphaeria bacterium]
MAKHDTSIKQIMAQIKELQAHLPEQSNPEELSRRMEEINQLIAELENLLNPAEQASQAQQASQVEPKPAASQPETKAEADNLQAAEPQCTQAQPEDDCEQNKSPLAALSSIFESLSSFMKVLNPEKAEQEESETIWDSLESLIDAEEQEQDEQCDEDSDEDSASLSSSDSNFSDADVVATLALGAVGGAALIGGGLLLYKLLRD